MTSFWNVVHFVLLIFLLLLIARFVVEWVMQLARSWRPGGLVAAGLEVVYSATDPPLKLLRKLIPPLRLGGISVDLGFIVLFFIVYILMSVVANLA